MATEAMFPRRGRGHEPGVPIVRLPGVFRPRSDTWLLADALREEAPPPEAALLDLCAGSGALAAEAVRLGVRDVTAVDRSRRAVACCRLNGTLAGGRVRARRGDLFAAAGERRFDVIVSNPPYVPAESDPLPRRGRRRATDAGRDGRALIDRICAQVPGRLRPGGVLLLVQSSVAGVPHTLRALRAGGLRAEVVRRRPGPLGPLVASRAAMLERRGLLAPGDRTEELAVIRAAAPGGRRHG